MRWSCTPPARWSWFPPGTEGGQPAATLAAPTRTTAATPRTGPKYAACAHLGRVPGLGAALRAAGVVERWAGSRYALPRRGLSGGTVQAAWDALRQPERRRFR